MKKLIKLILVILPVLALNYNSFADSPITSTFFHTAYNDINIVVKADRSKILDKEIADYLLSSKNSIDKKAAVCNALSWTGTENKNADLFMDFLAKKYKTSVDALNMNDLNADELLCLGYLTVLDNYFEPKPALAILEKAKNKNPESYTINIIYALVQSQIYLDDYVWCKVWTVCDNVRKDKTLKQDFREKANDIIFEYIDLYKAECK